MDKPIMEPTDIPTAAENESQSRHTPGPWTIKLHGCFGDKGEPLCGVWIEAGEYHSVANLMPHTAVQADARLIAAAPDLLAALKSARTHVCGLLCPSIKRTGDPWTHVPECEAITAAIAKAEGSHV